MIGERCVLRVQYTPVSAHVRKQVGGFVKYIEHRDQHPTEQKVSGLLKYVAHRDRTQLRPGLFNRTGDAGSLERRQLVRFVQRATENQRQQQYRNRKGELVDGRRAVHRLIISPEFAAGLDLKQIALAAMAQLEKDAGGLGPWLAAEHRNTKHPHVHVVLAARREIAPGKYRSVAITRPRLARMKEAMHQEIDRQRGRGPGRQRAGELVRWLRQASRTPTKWGAVATPHVSQRSRRPLSVPAAARLRGLARRYQAEAEREALRVMRDRERER